MAIGDVPNNRMEKRLRNPRLKARLPKRLMRDVRCLDMNQFKLLFLKMCFKIGTANEEEIEYIDLLNLSQNDKRFLMRHFPKTIIEANVKLLPMFEINEELNYLVPGIYLSKYGYFPIARSFGGDLFCISNNKRDGNGFAQVAMFYPGGESSYCSLEKVEKAANTRAYGIEAFFKRCFYDEDILEK